MLVTASKKSCLFCLWCQVCSPWVSCRPFRGSEGSEDLFECCRQDDPEPVKRLKREMAVALSEEDYSSAARIRDHPFMKLAVQIMEERLAGRDTEAKALQVKLQNAVKGQQ